MTFLPSLIICKWYYSKVKVLKNHRNTKPPPDLKSPCRFDPLWFHFLCYLSPYTLIFLALISNTELKTVLNGFDSSDFQIISWFRWKLCKIRDVLILLDPAVYITSSKSFLIFFTVFIVMQLQHIWSIYTSLCIALLYSSLKLHFIKRNDSDCECKSVF